MIYALMFLYIVPAIHFYREALEEPELLEGLQWVIPVFLWPIMLPGWMIWVTLFGASEEE